MAFPRRTCSAVLFLFTLSICACSRQDPPDPDLAGLTLVSCDHYPGRLTITTFSPPHKHKTHTHYLSSLYGSPDCIVHDGYQLFIHHGDQLHGKTSGLDLSTGAPTHDYIDNTESRQFNNKIATHDGYIFHLREDHLIRVHIATRTEDVLPIPLPISYSAPVIIDNLLAYQAKDSYVQLIDIESFTIDRTIPLSSQNDYLIGKAQDNLLIASQDGKAALASPTIQKFSWGNPEITKLPYYRGWRTLIDGSVEARGNTWYIATSEIPYQTVLINAQTGRITTLPDINQFSMILLNTSDVPWAQQTHGQIPLK